MSAAGRPTRATTPGRVYLDLQNLARRRGRPTDELHLLYALEGFLSRLAASPHAGTFVLKGGVLLAAFDARRPTRDIDVHAPAMEGDGEKVLDLIREIAAMPADDGLVFDPDTATAESIREGEPYTGVRVTLTASLARAQLRLHVDVNTGDPIWPAPRTVVLPRLLGGTITLAGYPLAMVYAEKILTALQRGTANTRWRDFADLYLLTGLHRVGGDQLQQTLVEVATYRRVALTPLAEALEGYAALAQARWAAWRRKQRLDQDLPRLFAEVLEAVLGFSDPALAGSVTDRSWNPSDRAWI